MQKRNYEFGYVLDQQVIVSFEMKEQSAENLVRLHILGLHLCWLFHCVEAG